MARSESSSDAPLSTLTPEADAPPPARFFYGWVMLPIAMAGVVASAPAQTFGVAPFNEHFRASLSLTETQLTAAYGLGTFLAALPMRFIGGVMDRYGIRKTKTVVILLFGLVCILTALAQNIVMLFIAFFFLRFLGQGALGGLLSGSTLAFWFEKRLGTVEGIRHLGVAGAIAIVPAGTIWLIQAVGWRWAYVVLGLIVWATMLPLMLLFRNRPEDIGQHKDNRPPPTGGFLAGANGNGDSEGDDPGEGAPGAIGAGDDDAAAYAAALEYEPERDFTPAEARRTRAFWLALLPHGGWALMCTGVTFSAIPLFAERGVSVADVPMFFTTFSLGFAVMIVVGGYLADCMRLNVLLMLGTACMTASWVLLLLMGEAAAAWLIHPAGLLMGLTQGLLVAAIVPLWPRYFGRKHLGKLKSALVTLMVAASAVGPFLMGVTRDLTGSYELALMLFAIASAPMVLGSLWATPPPYPPRVRHR